MGEKRRSKRHARRLRVRFGAMHEAGFPHVGITSDVSATGLFVISTQRVKPGDRLHLELTLQDEKPLYAEVVVARKVDVPPELRQVVHAGFGARYLTGTELMGVLVPSLIGQGHRVGTAPIQVAREPDLAPDPPPAAPSPAPPPVDAFVQVYDSVTAWNEAVEREFKRGGVFLWCPAPQASNALVTITFDLRFAGRQVALPARVVHSAPPGPDGRHGVALMFTDPGAVAQLAAAGR